MKKRKKYFFMGATLIFIFTLWTGLIQRIDVQPIGPLGTKVGFAGLNQWLYNLTGTNLFLYTITDWLGLIPLFVCIGFAVMGLIQLISRKNILKVDIDILLLGLYYIVVIGAYLFFEEVVINYRPTLIEGRLEASYPSSTTLLVLSVMPTLMEQCSRRWRGTASKLVYGFSVVFSLFMLTGRLLSGVHWLTDIVGAMLLSSGLFSVYYGLILLEKK